jgi:hypothetical protein
MLDRERGEMGIGDKIPVHAGQREQFAENGGMALGRLAVSRSDRQASHAVTASQAAAIDNGRGIIRGFVDKRRKASRDAQGNPSATEAVICPSSQSRAVACLGDLLSGTQMKMSTPTRITCSLRPPRRRGLRQHCRY